MNTDNNELDSDYGIWLIACMAKSNERKAYQTLAGLAIVVIATLAALAMTGAPLTAAVAGMQ